MDFLTNTYFQNPDLWNAIIALLVFGGMGRIAFWRNYDGLRVGGLLATGLALLLSVSLIVWARENNRTISELGPIAVVVLLQAIIIMMLSANKKAKEL